MFHLHSYRAYVKTVSEESNAAKCEEGKVRRDGGGRDEEKNRVLTAF